MDPEEDSVEPSRSQSPNDQESSASDRFRDDTTLQLENTSQGKWQAGAATKLHNFYVPWDHVQAYREEDGKWHAAVIIKGNGDDTYAIVWAPPNEKWPTVPNMPDAQLRASHHKPKVKARRHSSIYGHYVPRGELARSDQVTPGPGAYNLQSHMATGSTGPKYTCRLGSVWAQKVATRHAMHQKTPGPGDYRPPPRTARSVGSAPAFSFGRAGETYRCQDTPGPGCYRPKITDARPNVGGLSYSVRTKLKI